ncbi:phage major capsid protein [Shewanella baltica]|uniref:phage major capsid protein n=1 Tax=Shewanella baltica TaxID=62322 RepID=UPI003D7A6C84
MKLHEMLQKRSAIAVQMRQLNEQAKEQKRAFSEEENKRWGDMQKEHDDLDALIQREELLRSQDERYAQDDQTERSAPQSTEEQKRAEAFSAYLRQGFAELSPEMKEQLRAMGVATGAAGGFTVPTEFVNRVAESMRAFGGLANVCQVLNTSNGNPIPWATTDGTGEEGEMIAENEEASKGDPSFGQIAIGAKKMTSKIILVSNELLTDSAIDIDGFVARRIGQRLGRGEARQIMTGDGQGNNIKGLVNQITKSKQASLATAVAYEDLIQLKHSVDPAYRTGPNVRFMFNDNVFKGFKLMKDSQGRPLWLPAIAGVAPATIDGDQYVIDQALADPAAGKASTLYGDFYSVILRRVAAMALRRLTERYAEFDQMGFLAFHRFDVLLEDKGAVGKLIHA